MNSKAIIKQYLSKRRQSEDDLGRFPFVTISRQPGCMSKGIAEEVVRQIGGKLDAESASGWEVFDQELCNFLADEPKLAASLNSLITEEYRSEMHELVQDMIRGTSRQFAAYKKTFTIIRALALLGRVIIIGRGGVHVTQDLPMGIHVRLVGQEEIRAKRFADTAKISPQAALEKLREMEKARSRMVREFFDRDISDPLSYDAVFNIDRIPTQQIAAQIVGLIKARLQQFNS
jgi:cytidylate kinase